MNAEHKLRYCVTVPNPDHSRNVKDVVHKVVAVGSRSTESAQNFINTYINGDKSVKPYGSYAGLFADKVSCMEAWRQTSC